MYIQHLVFDFQKVNESCKNVTAFENLEQFRQDERSVLDYPNCSMPERLVMENKCRKRLFVEDGKTIEDVGPPNKKLKLQDFETEGKCFDTFFSQYNLSKDHANKYLLKIQH